jgi:hypothetical protein
MSEVISAARSAVSSSQVSRTGSSTSPETVKSHVDRSVVGTVPAWSTGHLSVRYWPGGSLTVVAGVRNLLLRA